MEAAENLKGRVRKTLLKSPALDLVELKGLLDAEAQNSVVDTLKNAGVDVKVISEEGDVTLGKGAVYLIVDPIDGTTNLAKGIPLASTSILLSETPYLSGSVFGLVMNLYSGEAFIAERNKGAWRGEIRIKPAKPKAVNEALISLDISKGAPIEPVKGIIGKARYLRQLGCTSISLCHVASGLMDAHVDLRGMVRVFDVAAGLLILKEAGGSYSVNGVDGGDIALSKGIPLNLIAASSPRMLDEIENLTA
jgi:myo-inositol-1(or 4)-monophosphatase